MTSVRRFHLFLLLVCYEVSTIFSSIYSDHVVGAIDIARGECQAKAHLHKVGQGAFQIELCCWTEGEDFPTQWAVAEESCSSPIVYFDLERSTAEQQCVTSRTIDFDPSGHSSPLVLCPVARHSPDKPWDTPVIVLHQGSLL